jgi:hypothetical protein
MTFFAQSNSLRTLVCLLAAVLMAGLTLTAGTAAVVAAPATFSA